MCSKVQENLAVGNAPSLPVDNQSCDSSAVNGVVELFGKDNDLLVVVVQNIGVGKPLVIVDAVVNPVNVACFQVVIAV
jgi:hypothetical protein